MASFTERMIGAAKLDAATYEEVEADPNAMGQAIGVVLLSALSAGIGSLSGGLTAIVFGGLRALTGWVIWSAIIFLVGTKLLPDPQTKADLGQLLRTLGFAAVPGVLGVLGVIPILGILVFLVIAVWQIATTVVATRQALDYQSTGKAIAVCLVGWVAAVVVGMIFGALGLTAAMF
jgi:hypothetical protein